MLKAQNKNIKNKLNYQNIKLLKDKEKKEIIIDVYYYNP
jgi:hypothetical protein